MKRWWLSFAGDEGFRGACIVSAHDFVGAIKVSHALGINPGGEVMFVEMPPEQAVPKRFVERLLSKADIEAFDRACRWCGVAVVETDDGEVVCIDGDPE